MAMTLLDKQAQMLINPLFQSEIVTSRQISGADACAPGRPAVLPVAKVKLHYVVHYLHRGTFNGVVPELHGEDRERVDAYVCNICQKPFRDHAAS